MPQILDKKRKQDIVTILCHQKPREDKQHITDDQLAIETTHNDTVPLVLLLTLHGGIQTCTEQKKEREEGTDTVDGNIYDSSNNHHQGTYR